MEKLQAELGILTKDDSLSSAHVGVYIASVDRGEVIYDYNGKKRFIPASNIKLFTTAAALEYLSPYFVYETELLTNGTIDNGILHGDLIVAGKGDPTLSSYFHNGRPETVFETWADSLFHKGIKEIRGNMIVDTSYFHDTPLGTGWSWDDEIFCYSAQRQAFSFRDNCMDIFVSPGVKLGSKATIRTEPESRHVNIDNRLTTGRQDSETEITFSMDNCTNILQVSGVIPYGTQELKGSVAIKNPASYGAAIFKEILGKKGILFSGRVYISGKKIANNTNLRLDVYRSPKLSKIIALINKESKNFHSEQIFLTMGKELKGQGNSQNAVAVVKGFLKGTDVGLRDLLMVDGSGLSRYNLATPRDVVMLLSFMSKHRHFNVFYDSLSIAGVDGTLKNRMRGTPAQNNVRGKTGSMNNIRNLSGYVRTQDGELLAFSMMCNHFSSAAHKVNEFFDRICLRLSQFTRK